MADISKATALYLLQSGAIPCKDTGKKTRRYAIKTDDVIEYLRQREIWGLANDILMKLSAFR